MLFMTLGLRDELIKEQTDGERQTGKGGGIREKEKKKILFESHEVVYAQLMKHFS